MDAYTQLIDPPPSPLEHIKLQGYHYNIDIMARPHNVYEGLWKSLSVMNVTEWKMEIYQLWNILNMQKIKK